MGTLDTIRLSLLNHLPSTFYDRLVVFTIAYACFCTLYWIVQIIYRLTFHPLARFPGPFLCRIGWYYQMYFEAIKGGKLLEKWPQLHEKYGRLMLEPYWTSLTVSALILAVSTLRCVMYTIPQRKFEADAKTLGPIIRINPNEVHIKDPECFHVWVQKLGLPPPGTSHLSV